MRIQDLESAWDAFSKLTHVELVCMRYIAMLPCCQGINQVTHSLPVVPNHHPWLPSQQALNHRDSIQQCATCHRHGVHSLAILLQVANMLRLITAHERDQRHTMALGQVLDHVIGLDLGPAVRRKGQYLGEHEHIHKAALSSLAESTLASTRRNSCQLVTVLPSRPLVMYLSSL